MRTLIFSLVACASLSAQILAPIFQGGGISYYVDSVNGNDSNTGKSAAQAWATITKLNTVGVAAAGKKIAFAKGSYWRGQLDFGQGDPTLSSDPVVGTTLLAYGTGKLPTIDGAAIIDNATFVQNVTYSVVYQTTWTPVYAVSSPNVWEAGVRLARAATLLACSTTAGSYYSNNTITPGTPQTVYIHASDDSDMITNGKLYEISAWDYALFLGDNATVLNLHTRRSSSNNGSLRVGLNSFVQGVLVEDGTAHNLFIGSGTVDNSICWKADKYFATWQATSTFMFIGYPGSGSSKLVFSNSKAVGELGYEESNIVNGFYAHGGASAFGNVQFVNDEMYYLSGGLSVGAAEASGMTISNSMCYEVSNCITAHPSTTISGLEWFNTRKVGTYVIGVANLNLHAPIISITNSIFSYPGGNAIKSNYEATVSVTSSDIVNTHGSNVSSTDAIYINSTVVNQPSSLTLSKIIWQGVTKYSNDSYFASMGAQGAYTGDYSVFENADNAAYGRTYIAASNWTNATAYKAANPTLDTHSIIGAPGWSGDYNNRVYTLTPGGNAANLGAGADPAVARTVNYAALAAALAAM